MTKPRRGPIVRLEDLTEPERVVVLALVELGRSRDSARPVAAEDVDAVARPPSKPQATP